MVKSNGNVEVKFRATVPAPLFGREMEITGYLEFLDVGKEGIKHAARDVLRRVFREEVDLAIQFDHWVEL